MGAQKNRLIETVLLSTHNICFGWEIRKLTFHYTLLTKVLKHKVMDADDGQEGKVDHEPHWIAEDAFLNTHMISLLFHRLAHFISLFQNAIGNHNL